MASGKISMQQLDAAMLFTSYPIKKLLLSNYSDTIKKEDLEDDYTEFIASTNLALDHGKTVKISLDLVRKDFEFNFNDFDMEEKDKISNVMIFLRLCLDVCTPLYTNRFEGISNRFEGISNHLKCDNNNMTYYIEEDHEYRIGIIIE